MKVLEGTDVALHKVPNNVAGEVLAANLVSKGFCAIDMGLEDGLLEKVQGDINFFKTAGRFYQPAEAIANGLLGIEGSARIAELEAPYADVDADSGLLKVDGMVTDMGALLNQYYDELGFDMSHRTSAVLHESGAPDEEGPPLTEKDVSNWLEKFLRHKLMVLAFIGPMEGVLSLKVYNDDETDAYEIPTAPGMMVVLRPDIMSHQHIALGKTLVLSSFFIDGHAFQKSHATGGWIMCPPARELDNWAMERIKVLKDQTQDESEWDASLPREWQRAMNLWYFSGSMVAVRGTGVKVASTWNPNDWFQSQTNCPDMLTNVPLSRWDHHPYYDSNPECWRFAKTFANHGAFMDGVDLFDAKQFSISVAESRGMDPNQRQVLEVGYEALWNMGMKKNTLMNGVGSVYVGHTFGDFGFAEKSDGGVKGPTSGAGCIVANRLSFVLGIKGPSMTLDTDQSSSMIAAYMTAESVQRKGRGVMADFGVGMGSQLMVTPIWWTQHCAMGWISYRGRCLTFDASASGFARGEGVIACAMRPIQEVVDGQPVVDGSLPFVGAIAGCTTNVNGKGASLSAPNGLAEQEVIANTVRNAGIAASDVDCVEAHGSGAFLADVVEVGSLLRSHRNVDPTPLQITSVKTLSGNLMETGGIASMLKNMMGAQWGYVAPGLHLREVNPHMDIVDAPINLLSECLAHSRKHTLSGCMSQGFGGSNVYAITWGEMDTAKVLISAASSGEQIHFWPGGGGFLENEMKPVEGYYIVGSWTEWCNPEEMADEGKGVYGYTVTLGDNGWEQFQILLDGSFKSVVHPPSPKAPKQAEVMGPDDNAEGCTWMIDGRCDLFSVQDGDDAEASSKIVSVGSADMGKPGDRYRVQLRIHGKWRQVTWTKQVESADDTLATVPIGNYYIYSNWNSWTLEKMAEDSAVKGLFYAEVKFLKDRGEFQIIRNRDSSQTLYPGYQYASSGSDREVQGPDEWGQDKCWFIDAKAGDVFRIEFQRTQGDDKDEKAVTWRRLREERLTPEESFRVSQRAFTIAGSWDKFSSLMTWDGKCYTYRLTMGKTGDESFQILQGGLWDMVLHPNVEDANPHEYHVVLGPHAGGQGMTWTVGAHPDDQARAGAIYEIKLFVSWQGAPQRVEWEKVA